MVIVVFDGMDEYKNIIFNTEIDADIWVTTFYVEEWDMDLVEIDEHRFDEKPTIEQIHNVIDCMMDEMSR